MNVLNEEHQKQLMDESGIRAEVLNKAGIFSVDGRMALELVGTSRSGVVFPYIGTNGTQKGFRLRKDVVAGDEGKYHQAKGSRLTCFFLKESLPMILDKENPLFIVEGEKKGLAVLSLPQFIEKAVVSVPGCLMWTGDGTGTFVDVWSEIPYQGRDVYMIVDSDYFFNQNVTYAYDKLMKELMDSGANVHLIDLRLASSEDKIGADDFLVAKGADKLKERIFNPCWTLNNYRSVDFSRLKEHEVKDFLKTKALHPEVEVNLYLSDLEKSTGLSTKKIKKLLKSSSLEWDELAPRKKKAKLKKRSNELQLERGTMGTNDLFESFGQFLDRDENLFIESNGNNLYLINIEANEVNRLLSGKDLMFEYSPKIDFIDFDINAVQLSGLNFTTEALM